LPVVAVNVLVAAVVSLTTVFRLEEEEEEASPMTSESLPVRLAIVKLVALTLLTAPVPALTVVPAVTVPALPTAAGWLTRGDAMGEGSGEGVSATPPAWVDITSLISPLLSSPSPLSVLVPFPASASAALSAFSALSVLSALSALSVFPSLTGASRDDSRVTYGGTGFSRSSWESVKSNRTLTRRWCDFLDCWEKLKMSRSVEDAFFREEIRVGLGDGVVACRDKWAPRVPKDLTDWGDVISACVSVPPALAGCSAGNGV
jgi:hypothetical protein